MEPEPDEAVRRFLTDHDVACPGCGYNLRGLSGSSCPECGFGFNLGALVELDRRARFTKAWRRATAIEYRRLIPGAGILLCAAVIAARASHAGLPGWMTAFALEAPAGGWTLLGRRWGVATALGLVLTAIAAWERQWEDVVPARGANIAQRGSVVMLAAHVLVTGLSLVL